MYKKLITALMIILCLLFAGSENGSMFVNKANAVTPTGNYSITPINQFSSGFSITLEGVSNAAYFNIFKISNNTLVNSVPVSINSSLNSMPAVYADIADLEVRVYSDAAATNTVAEFTLNSSNQLVLKGTTGPTLTSIALTTTNVKTSYKVGEAIDITGLVVTGTYSDGSSKVETITTANVTGFDSSAVTPSQTLTVTVGGQTATYTISIAKADGTISPVSGNFDKNTANQADIPVTVTLNGNTLVSINNGETTLNAGTDYTVAENVYTISKAYLAARAVGTTTLTFHFDAGVNPTLTITVSDSSTGTNDNCFIATAAFGSKFQPSVALLRQFRDKFLMTNELGRAFVAFYYKNSPSIADYISKNENLKAMVRVLLTPAVAVAYLMLHPRMLLTLLIIFAIALLLWRKTRRTIPFSV